MKKNNPLHPPLLILALLAFGGSFLLNRQTFDIRIFDTFYVLHLKNLYWWLAAALVLCWLFYTHEPMPLFSQRLKNIHLVFTLLAAIMILCFHIYTGQLYFGKIKIDVYDVELFQKHNWGLTFILLFLAFGQLFVSANVLWGYYLKYVKKSTIRPLR